MDYTSFCIIAGIAFWLLAALAVVAGIIWVYCCVQYYRWDKQDREKDTFVNAVQAAVKEAINQAHNESISQEADILESDDLEEFVM